MKAISAILKNGTLHYISKNGITTSDIDNAVVFDEWYNAREAIFSRGYNRDCSAWFVFVWLNDRWEIRDSLVC